MSKLGLIPEAIIATCGATILTALTYYIGVHFGWIDQISWLEFTGVALNYACVYLVTRQNILSWPIGIAASAVLGVLFWNLNLLASMTLQLIYFTPVQFIGWYIWWRGVETLASTRDLDPTWLDRKGITFSILAVIPIWGAIVAINTYFGGASPFLDSAILVLSVIAQWLLNYKKIESWMIWIFVNIISLYTYFHTGAFLAGFQYMLFLANAVYGLYLWAAYKTPTATPVNKTDYQTY